jgi:hypothetical protein
MLCWVPGKAKSRQNRELFDGGGFVPHAQTVRFDDFDASCDQDRNFGAWRLGGFFAAEGAMP